MAFPRAGIRFLALTLIAPVGAGAQKSAECATSECAATTSSTPAYNRLWVEAASIHKLKLEFVDGLQRFTRAQAGTFGDEGNELRLSLESMRDALDRWDRAVKQFQSDASRLNPVAEVHVAVATVLLDRHRLEDAARELKAAESQDDNRPDIYALQALAYAALDRDADAARALRRATALNPDNAASFYTLARLLVRLDQQSDASRAIGGFQRALSKRTPALAATAPAVAPFERVDLLRQAAGVAPIFPQARYVDGFVALRTGDYATAVDKLRAASAGDPLLAGDSASRERVARAAALIRQGQLDAALRDLQALVVDSPDHAEAHRLLGLAYWIDEQSGKSIAALRSAIRLAPGDERARVVLADVLAGDRRLAEAERELTQALERGPRSGRVHHELALLYERQSLLPQAAKSFHDSEALGPIVGRDEFYRTLGAMLVNQADFDGAVAAYSQRLEANPNSGDAHRQLGEIYFLQGRDEQALAEFLAAAWLDPRDAKAFAAAGQVQARLLKYADAVVALDRALALDPGLREARYALGTSLMRLGKTAEAKQALETFQQQQADAEGAGQLAFRLDVLRRDGAKNLQAGAFDQAIASYAEALELEPDSARSRRDLGLALLRAKRSQEAIEQLEVAQRLEATAEGFAYLADAYSAAGDRDAASRQRALAQQLVQQGKLARIGELGR